MFEKDGVIFFDRIDLNGNLIQTAEEAYNAWANREQIDNCTPQPTTEERFIKLEEEKAILAENVYQLASIMEIMLGGTESGQTEAIAETTTD